MTIKIITDSTCDLPFDYIKKNDIDVIPFPYQIDGINYEDDFGNSIKYDDFYAKMRNGKMPTTSQITTYTFENHFKKYIKKNQAIIYIGFSSKLSQTFNNAIMAKRNLIKEDYSIDLTIIDSKSAAAGQGLLIYYVNEMVKKGNSKKEIINWIDDNIQKINIWFTVDNLDHLKRGGRISAVNATIGNMLQIKPILLINSEGKLVLAKKVRGKKKFIAILLAKIENKIINPENQTILISHADCLDDAKKLKELVFEKFNVKNIIINDLSPILGTHVGPGNLTICFLGKNREATI
jgi:DegV family protein with EDD domain